MTASETNWTKSSMLVAAIGYVCEQNVFFFPMNRVFSHFLFAPGDVNSGTS